jgi:hypothetical protein
MPPGTASRHLRDGGLSKYEKIHHRILNYPYRLYSARCSYRCVHADLSSHKRPPNCHSHFHNSTDTSNCFGYAYANPNADRSTRQSTRLTCG